VVRFDRALVQAARFTTDPAKAAVVKADIFADEPPFEKSDPTFTDEYYAITVDPVIGQYRHLEIDPRGMYDVLALRQKYDGFDQNQSLLQLSTPLGGLYTERYVLDAELGSALQH
jgi:hypothetical protein